MYIRTEDDAQVELELLQHYKEQGYTCAEIHGESRGLTEEQRERIQEQLENQLRQQQQQQQQRQRQPLPENGNSKLKSVLSKKVTRITPCLLNSEEARHIPKNPHFFNSSLF